MLPTEREMRFMRWLRRTRLYLIAVVLILLFATLCFVNMFNPSNSAAEHTWMDMLPHTLQAMLIVTWLLIAPMFYEQLQNLGSLFADNAVEEIGGGKETAEKCIKHRKNRRVVSEMTYRELCDSPTDLTKPWARSLYRVVWILIWGILFCGMMETGLLQIGAGGELCLDSVTSLLGIEIAVKAIYIPFNPSELILFLLLLTAAVLNYSSYYRCIVLARFVSQVPTLRGLKYNIYVPSATWDFQILRSTSNLGYLFFLLDSTLCMLTYIVGVYLKQTTHFLITLFAIAMSAMSFIFLFISLIYSMWKLHNEWRITSLHIFQYELYQARRQGRQKTIEAALVNIQALYEDRFRVGSVTIAVSVSTLLVNVVTTANMMFRGSL